MIINEHLLVKVKTSIRINHSVLDDDISDSVMACIADLRSVGVLEEKLNVTGEVDPLILNAIKSYCKAEYTDDVAKAARYQAGYDSMKAHLMMAEGYGYEEDDPDE